MEIRKRYLHKFLKHTFLCEDGILRFEKEGMGLTLVDLAHVCMVDLALSSEAFETYYEEDDVGIKFKDINRFIEMFKFDDVIDIEFEEHGVGEFVKLKGRKDDLYTLVSTRPLVNTTGMTTPSIPDLSNLQKKFEISNRTLRDMTGYIEKCYGESHHMKIEFVNDTIELFSEEDENSDRMIIENVKILENRGNDVSSLFALDFLKDISEKIRKSAELTVTLGEDYPVKISHEFEDGMGKCTYLLAPRIESV